MFCAEMGQCPTYLYDCIHTYLHSKLDTICNRLTVTRSKHRVIALNLANALFLTLDHMRGTHFQMTFDQHPDFSRLIFSTDTFFA